MTRATGFLAAAGAIVVAGLVLWYLSAPPKGQDGYLEAIAATAESVRSQIQTARIWTETERDGETWRGPALVGLQEAERDAKSALSEFQGHEPAPGTDTERTELLRLASDANQRLEEMRVAAQLEDWERVAQVASGLPSLADELDQLEERTRP